MGKLIFKKVNGLISIQDRGRFGVRRFGIPQSGVMDLNAMRKANARVGNSLDFPVIEYALNGFTLQAMEHSNLGFAGARSDLFLNASLIDQQFLSLKPGDELKVGAPSRGNYGYMSVSGKIAAKNSFNSYSTYPLARLGGLSGRYLKIDDVLISENIKTIAEENVVTSTQTDTIRIMKGPEWNLLREHPRLKNFRISSDSNRMAITLIGEPLAHDRVEMKSSAVIPGIIQLPPSGIPTILMKDCQTTGGYPRIAKVMDEDLGKLAQKQPGSSIEFQLVDSDYSTK